MFIRGSNPHPSCPPHKVVNILVAGGADLERVDSLKWTPLRLAVWKRRVEVVRVLVEAGADVQATVPPPLPNGPQLTHPSPDVCPTDTTALALAAQENQLPIARILLARTDASMAIRNNRTALAAAADRGHVDMVRLLLKGAGKEALRVGGAILLHRPAERGYMEVVQVLLAHGADINEVDGERGTPLHAAMYYNRLDMARLLLHSGADVSRADAKGRTALQRATELGLTRMRDELEVRGAHLRGYCELEPLSPSFGPSSHALACCF